MTLHLIQGSADWLQARVGKVTASRVADLIARTKTGWAATRANYFNELLAERLTGCAAEAYQSGAMRWGTENEPDARDQYEFRTDAELTQVGFVAHPTIAMSGASPDALVGENGLLEIKCPTTATHVDTLICQEVPAKYVTQMHWQMACTGRRWCDFVSFDPRMTDPALRFWMQRVIRDDEVIASLEKDVAEFIAELDAKVEALRRATGQKAAA